jgi:aspartate kinase
MSVKLATITKPGSHRAMNRVKYAPSQLQAISRMALIVQKYGGTSVGSVERIGAVADRVARFKSEGHDVVVVVSAMSGETNRLLALAKEIQANPAPRELDALLSTGEKVTTALLSMALHERDVRARSYSGNQVGILTDSAHNKARIQDIKLDTLKSELDAGGVPVVAGFRG